MSQVFDRRRPILFSFALLIVSLGSAYAESFTLDYVMGEVRRDYPAVGQLASDKLISAINRRSIVVDEGHSDREIVLFDVRESSEFAVSHIQGAIRVDPGIWTSDFIKKYGRNIDDKIVIFYCSVGVRSSKLAKASQRELLHQGAKHVYNLEGGIFYWHNLSLPLVNQNGPTRFVHPYNSKWGKLLTHSNFLSYKPGY